MITAPEGMTEDIWLARCAARFAEKATWLSKEECVDQATICWDECAQHDLQEHPEDCADEEMIEWTD